MAQAVTLDAEWRLEDVKGVVGRYFHVARLWVEHMTIIQAGAFR